MSRLLDPHPKESTLHTQSNTQSIFLSVPVAASYAIRFRIGTMQQSLLGIDQSVPSVELSSRVIDEFLTCIEFVSEMNLRGLREQISDDKYSRQFWLLSKDIAPDGNDIRSVGFTTSNPNGDRTVKFTTPKYMLSNLDIVDSTIPSENSVQIRGELLEANATKKRIGSIQVVDSSRKIHTIQLPRESVSDIVQGMFGTQVIVAAKQSKNRVILTSISKADEPND